MNGLLCLFKKKPSICKGIPCQQVQAPVGINWGLTVFLGMLVCSSIVAAVKVDPGVRVFLAGDIASLDVIADQNLRVEDREATTRKRDQVAETLPPVYDLSPDTYDSLKKGMLDVLALVRKPDEDLEKLRLSLSEDLNAEIGRETLQTWRSPDFQDLVASQLLPWIREAYARGVITNISQIGSFKNGVLLRELPSGMETLHLEGRDLRDIEQVKDDLDQLLKRDLKRPIRVRKAVFILVGPFLRTNVVFNSETTQARKREITAAVEPSYYVVYKGEMVVRQGERVSPEQQMKLQALHAQRSRVVNLFAAPGLILFSGLFLVLMHMSPDAKRGLRSVSERDWLMLSLLTGLFMLLGKFVELAHATDSYLPTFLRSGYMAYGLPLAGAAGVLAMFLPRALCSFSVLMLSFLVTSEVGGGLHLFVYYLVVGLVYVNVIKATENRQDVLRSIFPLTGLLLVTWLGVNLVDYRGMDAALAGGMYVLINAVCSLLLVLGLSPILEMIFGYSSRFRLMELMSLEQPLLQELMVKAPGTYHHALIVSNMVEAGARAIGASALLARVAALYHDIGKLKNPQYFIENLYGKENKHNKLSPSMSALILISHVKKGIELAREHKLGPDITDLIGQHHGTTLITYFYHKAQELAEAKGEEPVREAEFRYPGPKPQTKEAGLILLADAIEASSRTLVDPTPSRIKGHIQTIVRKIYTEGQLDESELTLRDLTQLSETFHRILTGIFHHRIEYPNLDAKKTKEAPAAPPLPEKAA